MQAAIRLRFFRSCMGGVAFYSTDQLGRQLFYWPIDEQQHQDARAAMEDQGSSWTDGLALQQLAALLLVERKWKLAGEHEGEIGLSTAVREGLGHSLVCARSHVSGAGDGVFASGTIPKGHVISVYAGSYLSAWAGLFDRLLRTLMPYLYTPGYECYQADCSCMDGSTHTADAQRRASGHVSPSACGQLANHPPCGVCPNAGFMTVHVPRSSVFTSLPISQYCSWVTSPTQVATLLVSLTKIQDGEEVFVDYKYSPQVDYPSWYTPCAGSATDSSDSWRGPSIKELLEHE